jgi:hypothetical protein
MSSHFLGSWVAQLLLRLAFLAGFVGTLWFANLFFFHGWAAYVPPEETELHLRWAKISAAIALSCLTLTCLSGWAIVAIRRRNRQSAA